MQAISSFPTLEEFKEFCSLEFENVSKSYSKDIFINPITLSMAEQCYGEAEYTSLRAFLDKHGLRIGDHSQDIKSMAKSSRTFDSVWYPQPDYIQLPTRGTACSAGYDFFLPKDVTVTSDEPVFIGLGVKAYMQADEWLALYIRSSLSKKMYLLNGTGVIDSDYADNEDNGGEIGVMVQLYPGIEPVELKKGERIVQGIFQKYLTVALDIPRKAIRQGGFGSTGN